jgi:rhodanese-related sulfurtransferase
MKILTVCILSFILMTTSNCGGQKDKTEDNQIEQKKTTVTVEEIKEISESDKEIFVLDVRTKPEFSNGHLSFTDDLISYDSLEFYLDRLPEDKETEIYCFCRSGRRSGIATDYLLSVGYKNVFNIVGGIVAWNEAGFEIVTE